MAGIVIGNTIGLPLLAFLLAAVLVLALLVGRWPMLQSVTIGICFLLLGMWIAPDEEDRLPDGIWTECVVASTPAERPKTMMAELLMPATGEKRRCYFHKDEQSRQLALGQNLRVRLHDYQFIGKHDWQPGGDGFSKLSRLQRLRIRALAVRERVLRSFISASHGSESAEEGVLAAMVLGDKSALPRQLRDTYSVSGASHILALSGLHLSIIYLLLMRLTLGRQRFWLSQILVVLGIWAYALLTGLSVSVVRAAVMLTVYSLFSFGGRKNAPLAVLSSTAMIMLLVDSSTLFDIGFQLSFMAMLGILLFHPLFIGMVSAKWMMRHRPVKWLYELLGVSVAAQLGTAPLVAFYFGRFSTWFMLTNIIVVPLATLILYGAVLMLLFPAMTNIMLLLVGLMNNAVSLIARLPLASIDGLQPSLLQVIMVYVIIATLYLLLRIVHSNHKGKTFRRFL